MREDTPARFIVCGDNPMAYRLVDELVNRYDAEVTVVVTSAQDNWAPKIVDVPGVRVIEANRLDEDAFRRAGVLEADALGLLDQDDAGNVDAALIAQELNPRLRLVVRMFNQSLGERISQLLDDCVVLSAAAIAAPVFVAAALDQTTSPPIQIFDRSLVATSREAAATGDIITGLAVTEGRVEPEVLPESNGGDLVLAMSGQPARPRPRRQRSSAHNALAIIFGARLRLMLGLFVGIFVVGTVALAWATGLDHAGSWSRAAYVAFLTEIAGADIDPTASGSEKITLIILSVVSIAIIPAITAAVVDSAVKARLRREAGALTEPMDNHIVVVGLGHVGTRVVRSLHESGLDVVAIERAPDTRGVKVARDLGIPVVIGDASQSEVLDSAQVAKARALVVVSTDDVTNLEISLLGRAAKPDLRVVLRLFDGEFADRVQRAFAINASRSVSYLAAPAFAAAMLGRQVIATIPVNRRVLLVAAIPVGANSALEGSAVAAVDRPHAVRLVAVRSAGSEHTMWTLPPGRRLSRTDELVVVATRAGLGSLLADSAPRPVDSDQPFRLLDPSQRPVAPEPREGATTSLSAEGAAQHPPIGPADDGSTGRA